MPDNGNCGATIPPEQKACDDKNRALHPTDYDQWLAGCTYTEYDPETGTGYTAWVYTRRCDHWGWTSVSDPRDEYYPGVCQFYRWESPGSCLSADSLVTKANGSTTALKDVAIGDLLKSPDGVAIVKAVNHYQDKNSHFYRINDFQFAITGNHPVKTTKGWKVVEPDEGSTTPKLAVGDVLITAKGEVPVTKIAPDASYDGKQTANISTLENKPFYVDGVLVKPFKTIAFTY